MVLLVEWYNSGKTKYGALIKMCEITCSWFPFLTQLVNSSFKLSSYFLTSIFLMTTLFLKRGKFSGHRFWESKTIKIHKNNVIKPKNISQLYSSLTVLWSLRLESAGHLLPPSPYLLGYRNMYELFNGKKTEQTVLQGKHQHSRHREQLEKKRIWGLKIQSGKGDPIPQFLERRKKGHFQELIFNTVSSPINWEGIRRPFPLGNGLLIVSNHQIQMVEMVTVMFLNSNIELYITIYGIQ